MQTKKVKGKGIKASEEGWEKRVISDREVLITKDYKTMTGFIKSCKVVLNRVFGEGVGEDQLTTISDFPYDERSDEEKIRDMEEVAYNSGDGTDKMGYDIEFPDKIYAFIYQEEEK